MSVTYPRAHRIHRASGSWAGSDSRTVADQPAHGVVVDLARRTASAGGLALELTRLEFDLLAHLVAHPQRVYSRSQLLEAVWQQMSIGGDRTVDVHIARLRRKLGPRYRSVIATVARIGYKFDPAPALR